MIIVITLMPSITTILSTFPPQGCHATLHRVWRNVLRWWSQPGDRCLTIITIKIVITIVITMIINPIIVSKWSWWHWGWGGRLPGRQWRSLGLPSLPPREDEAAREGQTTSPWTVRLVPIWFGPLQLDQAWERETIGGDEAWWRGNSKTISKVKVSHEITTRKKSANNSRQCHRLPICFLTSDLTIRNKNQRTLIVRQACLSNLCVHL